MISPFQGFARTSIAARYVAQSPCSSSTATSMGPLVEKKKVRWEKLPFRKQHHMGKNGGLFPMRTKVTHGARILLGLIFVVFGSNGFLHFLPQPPMSGPPADFAGALIATGYMFPLLKGTEVIAGALLLS